MATQREYSSVQLLPFVKSAQARMELASIFSQQPKLVEPVSAVVHRYLPMSIVTSVEIDIAPGAGEPPIRIAIDTTTEGEVYDRLQDEFWDWWSVKYAWASSAVVVAPW